jgi:hypothetical protein
MKIGPWGIRDLTNSTEQTPIGRPNGQNLVLSDLAPTAFGYDLSSPSTSTLIKPLIFFEFGAE